MQPLTVPQGPSTLCAGALQATDLGEVTLEWVMQRLQARAGGCSGGPGLHLGLDLVQEEVEIQLPEMIRAFPDTYKPNHQYPLCSGRVQVTFGLLSRKVSRSCPLVFSSDG